ncbi:type II 3-dehydroquinate dehydratase [Reichenbachiella carrageenanivorans]|uniref:3-dehydroquinate dehydratase n=1 Tax=Reichenbachiella carrageenanivorans TaxID=2979869 RepID=A0ABY6D0L2_9BACT|nr:type II 3-dehydroquinate dehydratase [Reichenbachiella carrageenanivorans]UXX79702.1 type II 3-dehydroquinate dehydratase [Reichenbachiella carrageenanivorans]
MKILILNGPNLNLLGKREPEIYGTQTFEDFFEELKTDFPDVVLSYFQSNHEGALIDKIHEVGFDYEGIVFNAGGYTHTSVALADAVKGVTTPVIEVHISNVMERESFRHHSYLTPVCVAHYIGLGLDGYKEGIRYLLNNKS